MPSSARKKKEELRAWPSVGERLGDQATSTPAYTRAIELATPADLPSATAEPEHKLSIGDGFFFSDTATTAIYTLSLHDALPIKPLAQRPSEYVRRHIHFSVQHVERVARSEEHTSELQSQVHLVCRRLLEKKKTTFETTSTARWRWWRGAASGE